MKSLLILLITCLFLNDSFAQKSGSEKMNIDYRHKTPPSSESTSTQSILKLLGVKKNIEKKMLANKLPKEPAQPPRVLLKNFIVKENQQNSRTIWTVSPKEDQADVLIVFLHGGAYMGNITKQHWLFCAELIKETNATILVADYPLTPEHVCLETYSFLTALYNQIRNDYPEKRIILMGDSAGGGLALGFAQYLKMEQKTQPEQIILFSPWLDVTMSHPKIVEIDKKDQLLSIGGLSYAGKQYAGSLDVKDYRVSPIYVDFTGLSYISIFTGTNDLLHPDAQKCKQLMKEQQLSFNYFEYPEMFHDWVLFPKLKESKDVVQKVKNLLQNHKGDKG
jgi:acetyl esterase/lipase